MAIVLVTIVEGREEESEVILPAAPVPALVPADPADVLPAILVEGIVAAAPPALLSMAVLGFEAAEFVVVGATAFDDPPQGMVTP